MLIQVNSDHNVEVTESLADYFRTESTQTLHRFEEHVTRLEIHLRDENGAKGGADDKRCMIEARMEGHQPFAATCHEDTIQKAFHGALDKIKHALGKEMDKMKQH